MSSHDGVEQPASPKTYLFVVMKSKIDKLIDTSISIQELESDAVDKALMPVVQEGFNNVVGSNTHVH
ncbi:hypothetical protein FPZ43_01300 [Mucilaginibacter pallidiroseus]|uniref:Uncharacterized protein n=1 Tax=Mucilaginibacter pallidiroseus TaxID=2599295 RepID=A0A563UIF6_9SPHI|nr:hypothetical protein [Mucilaginibacter pallidiroseus]TWR31145.1 hypothetical protein FPZ43_01300 [Mucilaginibacter pallidiroseus]